MIYFIQAEDGPIKIGYSRAPKGRLATLQTSNCSKLILLLTIKGGLKEEKQLHGRFSNLRLRNSEWFAPAKELLRFIDSQVEFFEEPKQSLYSTKELEVFVGKSIRNLRVQRDMTREELCSRAEISMNSMRHLEDGRCTLKTLVRVLVALGKTDFLLSIAPVISINPLRMTQKGKVRVRASKRTI